MIAEMNDHQKTDLWNACDGGSLSSLAVMADVWEPSGALRTETGQLLESAKDGQDRVAAELLVERFAHWSTTRELPPAPVVVAVPPSPGRANELVERLTAAVAAAHHGTVFTGLVRSVATPRLRDSRPDDRPLLARQGGYVVSGVAIPSQVVLVDDVVVTASTLNEAARVLRASGVSEVHAMVLARSRLG